MLSRLNFSRWVFAIAMLQGLIPTSLGVAAPNPPTEQPAFAQPIAPTPTPTSSLIKSAPSEFLPSSDPLDLAALDQLRQGSCATCSVTSNLPPGLSTLLTTAQTKPSLWWYRDQTTPGLVENWLVYEARQTQPARVDFILNRGIWSAMDYLERYAFINAMGTATSRFGYNSRFFQLQQASQTRLATYTCDFQPQPASTCQLVLESIGLNRFQ
jgi:hypothetical protein